MAYEGMKMGPNKRVFNDLGEAEDNPYTPKNKDEDAIAQLYQGERYE